VVEALAGLVTLDDLSRAAVAAYRNVLGKENLEAVTLTIGDTVVTIVSGALSSVERTLAERGQFDLLSETHRAVERQVETELVPVVESLLDRRVRSHVSRLLPEADLAVEAFVLEP
jgi:uncharacterized protein YbcI